MPDTLLAGGAISFRGALGFSVLRFGQFAFYGFSVFSKEVTPCGRANTAIPRDHLHVQLEECMTSLVSLAAVIWVVTAAKQTMKS